MKKCLVFVSGLILSMCVLADNDEAIDYRDVAYSTAHTLRALPPIYQSLRDINDIQQALMGNDDVPVSGIQSINLDDNVVYFKNECRAVFHRDVSQTTSRQGIVGPAAPLVLGAIVCDEVTLIPLEDS